MSSDASASVPASGHPEIAIAAVVFSLNEASLLPACLERLSDFPQLIVCDMHSEDETVEVAQKYGATVVEVPRVPIAEQVRQFGLDAAKTPWVLMVDADEYVPEGFYGRLVDYLAEHPELAAVSLRYDNLSFGRHVPHSLANSRKYALVRTSATRYPSTESRPHQHPRFDGEVADAPDDIPEIVHDNFRTVDQSLEKMLRYGRNSNGEVELLASPFAVPRLFVRGLIFSGSWRDGRAGLVLTMLNLMGRLYGAALAWERAGYPDSGWSKAQTRTLRMVTGTQRRLVRARDFVLRRSR
ncbi:glycosyltransferase [Humibacter albus]|uniref:glycosyltransferase n=1 Tax=Humibacter albus TaxID=427754 RepID=UPI0003B6A855|nr:glycosyltransferase [Humibacter albus]